MQFCGSAGLIQVTSVWSRPIHTYQKQLSIQHNTMGRKAQNLHIIFADSQLQRDTICCSFSFYGLVFETISQGENAYSWLGYVQPISGVCRWTQAYKQVVPLKSEWMPLTLLPVPGLSSVSNY